MTCEHIEPRYEEMPAGSVHHAKVLCAACGKFMGWLPKPATVERRKVTRELIEHLKTRQLSEWEKSFIESVSKVDKWSPRQLEKLDAIKRTRG